MPGGRIHDLASPTVPVPARDQGACPPAAAAAADSAESLLVQVALPAAHGDSFTYSYRFDLEPVPGLRVLVPWRKQHRVGILLGLATELPSGLRRDQVRPVACLLDREPLLDPTLFELLRWAADYYQAGLGEILQCALPPDLIRPRRLALTDAGRAEIERLRAAAAPAQMALPALPSAGAPAHPELACLRAAERGLQLPGILRHRGLRPLDLQRALRRGWIECRNDAPRRRAAPSEIYYRLASLPRREESSRKATGRISPARARVLAALEAAGGELSAAALAPLASRAVLRALLRRQAISACPRPLAPAPPEWAARPRITRLNSAQSSALESIVAALDAAADNPAIPTCAMGALAPAGSNTAASAAGVRNAAAAASGAAPAPPVFLLHGVTGSGKTAVYLEAIAACLARGRSALLLAPEIGLTPALEADFEQAFPGRVAILHSALGPAERSAAWYRARRGEARLVIGTRSAVFSPLPDLGMVIVDEEHDASFKQQTSPRYHARDLALMRARRQRAVALLGSATPSLESYRHARAGKYRLLELPQRVDARPLPRVELVAMREIFRRQAQSEAPAPGQSRPELVISPPLRDALAARLDRGEQSLVLINRRGYAPVALCRSCGQTLACRDCSAPLTWHKRSGCLLCHLCGFSQPTPRVCPACASEHIYFLGAGSEKVEEHLRGLFPAARLGRLDRDTVRGRRDFARVLNAFRQGELDILLGTQMIAKGHDLPGVTLVGVVQADLGLLFPDFHAAERTFQLLTQVAGRAGRAALPGEVYLQTLFPEHYAVRAAAAADYPAFWERESHFRRQLAWPPFAAMALVQLRGPEDEPVREAALRLRRGLDAAQAAAGAPPPVRILGPAPALVARIKREFRYQLLLKSPRRAALRQLLQRLRPLAAALALSPASLVVDVDPVTLA